MPSDLSSYLATHYLTADPKPSKKRKRKQANDGLIIADDDETGWSRSQGRSGAGGDDDDDTVMSATVAGTSAEFRKAKKSGWKTIGGGGSSSSTTTQTLQTPMQDDSARQADAILASAAAESAAAAADGDGDNAPVMMSDGTYAGLQSGATVSAQLARRRAAERAEYESGKPHKEAETIYRDATGRRVDVSMKRAELRREAEEAARKREEAELALRGDVQVEEARRRREALDDAKVMGVARHADDADMNAEMKAQVRWGDTMAAFVKPKDDGRGGVGVGVGNGRRVKGRPIYKGAWAPNRYQIPPGYRWDGVDRSNGFEAERFKAINRRERNKGLDYAWQMDE
ncbi:Pre-mRNA-splicing factor of RES complex-domain-containing protein [Xylariaceae sp. FL1651]|nr:Pre-mRNA-splicing factor of RES complex-domain-containing protein [Xylariaceae sp. FL1651]